MSQSATLYRVNKVDFDTIVAHPGSLDSLEINAAYETFDGSHEGLCFVLSKFGEQQLIDTIFYPKTFIGKEVDYNNMDDEALDALSRRIYYLHREQVSTIADFLKTISVEDFGKHFNADELNKEDIYPWVWNEGQEADTTYNEKHIVEDFKKLRSIFEMSRLNGDYILSYVG